jgi:glycosyltransferase involved in cell wall biosynthesis
LIDVLKGLDNRYKLLLVGNGDKKDEIVRKAENAGVSDRIIFVENTPEVEKYYSAMDIFVFPSLFEGVPVAPIEAQVNGLRCICSNDISDEIDSKKNVKIPLIYKKWCDEIYKSNSSDRSPVILGQFDICKQAKMLADIYVMQSIDNIKISIIIPAFNSEKYIEKCVRSAINQTYNNIEVIIVDDESTDNTVNIINKFSYDKRVNLVKQKNGGPNTARRKGIEKSHGDYIMFLDSDDWLSNDAVEKVVGAIKKHEPDAVKFNAITEPNRKKYYHYVGKNNGVYLSANELVKQLYCTPLFHELAFIAYRKNILIKALNAFDERMVYGEDYYVNLHVFRYIKKCILIDEYLYHYYHNENSTTMSVSQAKVLNNAKDALKLADFIIKDIKEKKNDDMFIADVFLSIINMYMWILYSASRSDKKSNEDKENIFNSIFNVIDLSESMHYIRDHSSVKEIKKALKRSGVKHSLFHGQMVLSIYNSNIDKTDKYSSRYVRFRW